MKPACCTVSRERYRLEDLGPNNPISKNVGSQFLSLRHLRRIALQHASFPSGACFSLYGPAPLSCYQRPVRGLGDFVATSGPYTIENSGNSGVALMRRCACNLVDPPGTRLADPKPDQQKEDCDHRHGRRDDNGRRNGLDVHIVLLSNHVGVCANGHR